MPEPRGTTSISGSPTERFKLIIPPSFVVQTSVDYVSLLCETFTEQFIVPLRGCHIIYCPAVPHVKPLENI